MKTKSEPEMITTDEAAEQIKLALRRAALIYHHFARTLIEEFGEERGQELIKKAIEAYGAQVGGDARQKARSKNLDLKPENFESDLPKYVWQTDEVEVDGEKRSRVHFCPLAAEWLPLGDSKMSRLYCFVDQAKMKAFNPQYEYIHLKNVLDGDDFCELVIRPVGKTNK
jgi:hypothetical protein